MKQAALIAVALLAACHSTPEATPARKPIVTPQQEFFGNLKRLCGKSFEGRVVSNDAVDDDFRNARVVMHVRTCSDTEVRIPLHVGEDRSRTWVIRVNADKSLELRHDHRHKDGSEDALTQYGGYASARSHDRRVEFPVDPFTKDLFLREGREVSITNTWAVEIRPEENLFAYELKRPERFFRVEFDTSKPVAPPPAPWGAE